MAVNIMHTETNDVVASVGEVRRHWGGIVGTYPHYGTHDPSQGTFLSLPIEPAEYARRARSWVASGTQLVGGCCGIGPEHIKALHDELPRTLEKRSH
jgi:S-methylmethionine-dependent homocysteine/selenocysteine methylase